MRYSYQSSDNDHQFYEKVIFLCDRATSPDGFKSQVIFKGIADALKVFHRKDLNYWRLFLIRSVCTLKKKDA